MPARKKCMLLPLELRKALDLKLIENSFARYRELSAWLRSQGADISMQTLHRYGQMKQAEYAEIFRNVQETTQIARSFVASDEDEQDVLLAATARVVQEHLMTISAQLRKASNEGEDPKEVSKALAVVARGLAELGGVTLRQKKWARELKKEAAQDAADAAAKEAKKQGVSGDAIAMIRQAIMANAV